MTFWPRETVYNASNDGRMYESRKSSTNFKFPPWSFNSKPDRHTYGGAAAVPLNVSQLPASVPTNRVDFIKTVRVTSSAENQKRFDSILNQERNIHVSNDRGHISRCTANSRLSRDLCDEIQKSNPVSSLDCNADLPPGTGVYYTPSRSINSKGYGHVRSDMQGLSLLADVSCEVNCKNQRSRNMNLKRPGSTPAYKGHNTLQRPSHPSKTTPTVLTDVYKIVKKLRTPRKTLPNSVHQRSSSSQEHNSAENQLPPSSEGLSSLAANHPENEGVRVFYNTEAGRALLFSKCMRNYPTKNVHYPGCDNLSATPFRSRKRSSHVAGRNYSDTETATCTELTQPVPSIKKSVRFSRPPRPLENGRNEKIKVKRAQVYSRRILEFIGNSSISEKLIREAVGNNPDTSKALRLLLAERKLKRIGDGGKGKAYVYVATPKGLLEIQEIEVGGELVAGSTPESESASSCNPTSASTCVTNLSKSFSIEVEDEDQEEQVLQPKDLIPSGYAAAILAESKCSSSPEVQEPRGCLLLDTPYTPVCTVTSGRDRISPALYDLNREYCATYDKKDYHCPFRAKVVGRKT